MKVPTINSVVPLKKVRRPKPFHYPHRFKVGQLIQMKEHSPFRKSLDIRGPGLIIGIKEINNVEWLKVYFAETGVTREFNIAHVVMHIEIIQ